MLPNFLVIGAMKAGTTSLYQYLRFHPQVFMPRPKELNFFVEHRNWRLGREWYERKFRTARRGVVVRGEASPSYSRHPVLPGVPERIAALLPDVKFIYLVRHPIERMYSHYLHLVLIGEEHRPIQEALLARPTYLATSRYALQIEQYLRFFPLERMLIIKSEDLRNVRVETIRSVYRFLGVDAAYVPPNLDREFLRTSVDGRRLGLFGRVGAGLRLRALALVRSGAGRSLRRRLGGAMTLTMISRTPVIPPDVRQRLEDLIREDMRRLRAYMGVDLDGWGLA